MLFAWLIFLTSIAFMICSSIARSPTPSQWEDRYAIGQESRALEHGDGKLEAEVEDLRRGTREACAFLRDDLLRNPGWKLLSVRQDRDLNPAFVPHVDTRSVH